MLSLLQLRLLGPRAAAADRSRAGRAARGARRPGLRPRRRV